MNCDDLVFTRRTPKDKYQVRFWSTKAQYKAFCSSLEHQDLLIQDVFNQFMEWFCNKSNPPERGMGALPPDEILASQATNGKE